MTINAVKDPTGKVVATFETPAAGAPSIQPILPAGHKIEPLVVEANYLKNLSAIYGTTAK